METAEQRKRLYFWDLVRGIAIFFVLYIHALGGWNYETADFLVPRDGFLYNLWMVLRGLVAPTVPVFVFISGYMVHRDRVKDLKLYYVGRAKRMLIPFLLCTVLYSLMEAVLFHRQITVLSVLLGTNAPPLYFLIVMVQLTLLTPLFFKCKSRKLALAVCIVLNLVNNVVHEVYFIQHKSEMNYEMYLCTCFIAYYGLGLALYKEKEPKIDRVKTPVFVVACIFFAAVNIFSEYVRLELTGSPTVAVSFITVANMLYTFSWIFLLYKLSHVWKPRFEKGLIGSIGRHTMTIYTLHWAFEYPMKLWMLKNADMSQMLFLNIVLILVPMACCLVVVLFFREVKRALRKGTLQNGK
ncbi:MAG: acyltransferase [Lachnospiraceae bacterium]|nr:acyltransferase [Lachnospiraceae bacterium]